MISLARVSMFALVLALAGCGGAKPDATAQVGPLTVAEWRLLPPERKYTAETIERLKEGDPVLATPEGWDAFNKTTLMESRKKYFPKGRK